MTKKNNNETKTNSKPSSKNLSKKNNNNSFNFGSEALKHHQENHYLDEKRYKDQNISSNKKF